MTLMGAIAFDTLKFAKRLIEAGFTEQQAAALAQAEVEFIEQNLATRHDLQEIEAALKRDIEELRGEIKRDIAEVKRDIEQLRAEFKRDIEQLRTELKRDIKELDVKIERVRSDLLRDMKDLEYRMTIKLGTLMVVAVGAIATLVKLL